MEAVRGVTSSFWVRRREDWLGQDVEAALLLYHIASLSMQFVASR
jgi:hypothetical protein